MRNIITTLLALGWAAASLTVLAQEAIKPPAKPPVVKRVVKETESHRFEGSRLKGNFKKPELSYIYQRKGLRAEQIIEFPEEFNEEISNGSRHY